MKKSLLALAVLGAAAVSAQAANVNLYGTVDAGFAYKHTHADKSTNSFKFADGLDGSSKVGIKGTEELGNGYSVGFKLENGFKLSNGQMKGKDGKVLFDREARVFVNGAFGELAAGRIAGLSSAAGSYDVFFANGDAFDGGDKVGTGFAATATYNNALVYKTPTIAGLTGYTTYSFSAEKDEQQDKFTQNDRHFGLGLTFEQGPGTIALTFEQDYPATRSKNKAKKAVQPKKPYAINLAANCHVADNVKLFMAGQYSKYNKIDFLGLEMDAVTNITTKQNLAGTIGAQIEEGANSVMVAAYAAHLKSANVAPADGVKGQVADKGNYFSLNARFTHKLSARTSIFAGADYGQLKMKNADKVSATVVYSGLRHNF